MPTDATFNDILTVVTAFCKAEGADVDRALCLILFNRTLDQISQEVGGFDTHWNNDSTDTTYGRLTLTDQEVTFPSDVQDIYPGSVFWDEGQLIETTVRELDSNNSDWRGSTGVPSYYARTNRGLWLDTEPTGSTDGLLVIHGRGSLPHLEEDEATNPLSYLVLPGQLALADAIIAGLPPAYAGKGEWEIKAMLQARQEAAARWAIWLPRIVHGLKTRATSPLGAM